MSALVLLAVSLSTASAEPSDHLSAARLGDLAGIRAEAETLRARLRALFLEPEIDRREVERAREDAVALFDRGTSSAVTALVDLAEVFTPEQRAVLQDRRDQMRERWSRWR